MNIQNKSYFFKPNISASSHYSTIFRKKERNLFTYHMPATLLNLFLFSPYKNPMLQIVLSPIYSYGNSFSNSSVIFLH